MEILELPDHKAYHTDIDKYLDEPLLEYVWIVANEFKPDCDGDGIYPSIAPVIFANRYIESKLTDEEKYTRYLEIRPEHKLEYAKDYYAKFTELNTSFKDIFFSKEEVVIISKGEAANTNISFRQEGINGIIGVCTAICSCKDYGSKKSQS